MAEDNDRKPWLGAILAVVTIYYFATIGDLLTGAGFALLPSMSQHGNEWNLMKAIIVASPLVVLVGCGVSWGLFGLRRNWAALIVMVMPLPLYWPYCLLGEWYCPLG